MKICTRCVLPETFPGIRFNEEGVCNHCLAYRGEEDAARKKRRVREKFEAVADDVRGKGEYQCVLAYSGGKDSSYTLWLLRHHYGLRVLAVTIDNGFVSPQAFVNIRNIVEAVNADSLVVKPRLDLLCSVFAGVIEDNPFPPKALERASSCCNACIGLVKNVVMRIAIDKEIPIMAFGWTPGQAPISAAFFRMNASMMRQMHDTRTAPLLALAGDDLDPYILNERHFENAGGFPYNVNPMGFHDYTEHQIVEKIVELGWRAPDDTDGNSSNCLLNALANRLHLKEYGFHPYAWEVGGLVRAGVVTREEGLESIADLGSEEAATSAAERLGLKADVFQSTSWTRS